jgi:hypothetical protein
MIDVDGSSSWLDNKGDCSEIESLNYYFYDIGMARNVSLNWSWMFKLFTPCAFEAFENYKFSCLRICDPDLVL